MNIQIIILNDTHTLKYMGPVTNMLTDYELDNHLNQILDISKRELFKNVRNWAYKKYNMFVTANFNTDGSVESISIGFANMSTTEVDEVFCTLFRDEI